MRKTLLFSAALLSAFTTTFAQSYTDDFESYNAGDYIAANSSNWTTWSGGTANTEDIKVDTTQYLSGNKSLYFKSTAANGGPQDCLLQFGGQYDLGNFEIVTNLFVESNNGAYFNIQGTTTPGQTYQVSSYFKQDGELIMTAPGINLTTTYPTNTWFELKLKANLNTSSWEIFIDNVSVGTYTAPVISVASMNFFPVNPTSVGGNSKASYWLDDVSFSLSPYILSQLNGGLLNFDIPTLISGQSKVPKVVFRNLGQDPITSAKVSFEYNGITNTEVFNFSTPLASKATTTLEPSDEIVLVNGSNQLKATILEVNGGTDLDANDNVAILNIDPIIPAEGKVVIAEEGTGTWCGWCPRGAVAMETAAREYKGYFQGIAVHNGDPMTHTAYDAGLGSLINGYPSALVDRGNDIDPSAIPTDFLERLVVAPKGTMINGATLDPNTNELKVSLTVNLSSDINANWKIACALVENNVTGTGSGYNQSNYYAGGNSGVMGGYENLPGTVPASQMVYQEVARSISPSFTGYAGFSTNNTAGSSETFNFTFQLSADWDPTEIHIVGLLIDNTGKIDNGSTSTIDEATTNGYVDGTNIISVEDFDFNPMNISSYPNPVSDKLSVLLNNESAMDLTYFLTDVNGKVVLKGKTNNTSKLEIDVNKYQAGLYILSITSKTHQSTQKITIQ